MINTDVIIVGSGIAGFTLAHLLLKSGIKFIVLDRIQKRRPIALAETVPPAALPLLESLDLLKIFERTAHKKTYGYHALWGSNELQTNHFYRHNPYKYGLKINKSAIIDHFRKELEKYIIPNTRFNLSRSTDNKIIVESFLHNSTHRIEGKIIVDATGRNRAVLKKIGVTTIELDNLNSFTCHIPRIKHENLVHDVITEAFEHGWGIISGLNSELQVMTIFTNPTSIIHPQLSNFTNWKKILQHTHYLKYFLPSKPQSKVKGGLANSSRSETTAKDFWIAIGDAAMAYDPLSSHGITNAIYTTKMASQAIVDSLQQKANAFEIYNTVNDTIVHEYFKNKNQMYRSEKRWKTSQFWKSYHSDLESAKNLIFG